MQFRCYSCKMPISIGRASVEQALTVMHEEDLVHYDFRCPKCKKSNRVSKEQLQHASPAWEYQPAEKTKDNHGSVEKEPENKAPAKKAPAKKESSQKGSKKDS